MRKKTKRLLLGIAIGAASTFLIMMMIGYFLGYKPYQAKISQYDQLLDSYRNPEVTNVYRINKDIKSHQIITSDDYEIIKIPTKIYNSAMLDTSVPIDDYSVNTDIQNGTILHDAMVYKKEEMPKDLRVVEFYNLATEARLKVDDIVDVRINFPSGLDYVVLSKKRLIDKTSSTEDSEISLPSLCIFYLNEEEILRTSSAIVDAYIHKGAFLYTTKYISNNSQEKAEITYPVNEDVQKLIAEDPNIVDRAKVALESQRRSELSASLAKPEDQANSGVNVNAAPLPAAAGSEIPNAEQNAQQDLNLGSEVD